MEARFDENELTCLISRRQEFRDHVITTLLLPTKSRDVKAPHTKSPNPGLNSFNLAPPDFAATGDTIVFPLSTLSGHLANTSRDDAPV
jgi:hypothetical protein